MPEIRRPLSALQRNELPRLATISPDQIPHVVPVCYVYLSGNFLVATDYETKKYRNLLKNDKVAILVDTYMPNRGILIQGRAETLEEGREFRDVYALFYRKFSWVRVDPWEEGEAPFIKIRPLRKTSWGLGSA